MKTLSGTFAFVALTVIAIVTLPSCYRKEGSEECLTDKRFFLKFGGPTDNDYVDVDQAAFDKALCALKPDQYDVRFLPAAGSSPIPHYVPSCYTEKITTSEAAKNAPAGESGANDPNATYRVYSNNAADIENVLKTFKASPTPTPSS